MRRMLFIVFSLLILTGCPPESEISAFESEVVSNETLWRQSKITDYQLNYSVVCFCPDDFVSVSVVNSEIVAVQITDSADQPFQDVEAINFPRYFTVDEFFRFIKFHAGVVPDIRARFHETLGYPILLYINFSEEETDSSLSFRIELQEV